MDRLNWILASAAAGLLLVTGLSFAAGDAAAEKEVLAAIEAWKQAILKNDKAALEKLYHPGLTYTHSAGNSQTKADALKSGVAGNAVMEAMEFSETSVRVQGNTALVLGKWDMRQNAQGKIITPSMNVLHVWIKGRQGWQMVARHATRLNP
ncbi:MAG: nuclear transport factor 2 family protein [Bryobacteraceae bacterium]